MNTEAHSESRSEDVLPVVDDAIKKKGIKVFGCSLVYTIKMLRERQKKMV